jgi:hypothetical protein
MGWFLIGVGIGLLAVEAAYHWRGARYLRRFILVDAGIIVGVGLAFVGLVALLSGVNFGGK